MRHAALWLILCAASCGCVSAAVWHVQAASPAREPDGRSWTTAFPTIGAALAAFSPGDEVWVAAGTYREHLGMLSGTALYGGFAGTETSREQRDWKANITVVDGASVPGRSVVVMHNGIAGATVLDGFTVTRGDAPSGGGILCMTSAVIAHNTIRANRAERGGGIMVEGAPSLLVGNRIVQNRAEWGGGIYFSGGSSTVVGNVIQGNVGASTGAGVFCDQTSGRIANNVFRANRTEYVFGSGGGLALLSSRLSVVNNTIVDNVAYQGGGLFWHAGAVTIANNIVAFNSDGLLGESNTTTLRNNCVFGFQSSGYLGSNGHLLPGAGDIQQDPRIARHPDGPIHIRPDSPCRDAGDNSVLEPDDADIDATARGIDGKVDIGADESLGEAWPEDLRVLFVRPDGSDLSSGLSWAGAKASLPAAMAAANPGDEIWVAEGRYTGQITMKGGVRLYGGFAGAEATRESRSWAVHPTILLGDLPGATVVVPTGFAAGTVLSGFMVVGSPLTSISDHGVIDLDGTNAVIENCLIRDGDMHGVRTRGYSNVTIVNCTVTNNRYSGILVSDSLRAVNNTIVGNGASGLYFKGGQGVWNNIIAYNKTGMSLSGNITWEAWGRNNCVFGNVNGNFGSGVMEAPNNISVDPLLAGGSLLGYHIQPGSPCRDAGDGHLVLPSGQDMDGQPRIQGGSVDIGADESDGNVLPPRIRVFHVSPTGSDSADGLSWESAKRTVQAAVAVARQEGGEVWVSAGVYAERVILPPEVSLFGGFAGGEVRREQRDPRANLTVLDARADYEHPGSTLALIGGGLGSSTVDGFTITGGLATYGGGISCSDQPAPTISGNVIIGNLASGGGGIHVVNGSPSILGNRIERNTAWNSYGTSRGGGIHVASGSSRIERNLIRENSASLGGGLSLLDSATVVNNAFVGNAAAHGGGLSSYGDATIVSNTFLDNVANDQGGAIVLEGPALVTLANNIIAFNSSDYYGGYRVEVAAASNCVFNNGNGARTAPSAIRSVTDVKQDPRIRKGLDGYPHLLPDSPCRDAGADAYVMPGSRDVEGQARIQGVHVDIGADESDGAAWPTFPRIVHVNAATGDDSGDGGSWETAKQTLQEAMREAGRSGGEVWVAGGSYPGTVTLPYQVALFGGFAGDETEASQRAPRVHESRISGGGNDGAVHIPVGTLETAIFDGFTVNRSGIGILVEAASALIRNNTVSGNRSNGIVTTSMTSTRIHGNTVTANGGYGIGCGSYSSPTISNNVVSHNVGNDWGGGISTGSYSTPRIVNNLIFRNGNPTTKAGGIYISAGQAPMTVANNSIVENAGGGIAVEYGGGVTLANNIVAFNTKGVLHYMATVSLERNCVFGNPIANYDNLDPGATDLQADPLFVGRTAGNWHISFDSPCVNAGDAAFVGAGEKDIDGDPRILRASVDIGADEATALEGVTVANLRRLLAIIAGLEQATTDDLTLYGQAAGNSADRIDLLGVVRILRRALGVDAS